MSIWERMNDLTKGKTEQKEKEIEQASIAKHGDKIEGVINNIVKPDKDKKKNGGYGFITSESLPFERVFFHWTGLLQDTLRFPALKKRMKVEFILQYNEYDGYRAIKIKVKE